jgi:type II secretory pathway component PulF
MNTPNEVLPRNGRVAFYLVCAIPVIFALQTILAVIAIPVFSSMYQDFGSQLPEVTSFVMRFRILWFLLAIFMVVLPFSVVGVKGISSRNTYLWLAFGLANFCLAQFITCAIFLPVFNLGAVTGQGS